MAGEGETTGTGMDTGTVAQGAVAPTSSVEVNEHGAIAHVSLFEDNPTGPKLDTLIPEAYKGKEWVQNILKSENPTIENLLGQFENAQSLIGKKAGLQVPGDNATPEQVQEWRKAIGVPESPDKYVMPAIEWTPEEKPAADALMSTRTEGFMAEMLKAAHEIGLTEKQFTTFMERGDRAFVTAHRDQLAEMSRVESELNADFDAQADKIFGNRKDQVLDMGNKLLDAVLPDNVKPLVAQLDNKGQVVLAAALDAIRERYIKEDKFSTTASTSGQSPEDRRARSQELMQHPAFNDKTHPQHERIFQQWKESYGVSAPKK